MSKIRILLGPSSFAESDRSPLNTLRSAGYEVVDNPFKRKLTKKELLELLTPDVIGTIAGLEPLDREVMQKSNLKVISRVGSGLSNVDLPAAKELGIEVCSTPNGPTSAVAELTLGAMLSALRMIPKMDNDLHNGNWSKRIGFQLEGKTVAIIGYGRIGRRVADLLSPFDVKIVVVDPLLSEESTIEHVKLPLEEALPLADIITIHSSGEECIISDKEFKLMKKGVFLLNVARGGLLSEEALLHAVEDKIVAGAWLDTFKEEPYGGPLCKYENVVLTPHVGSYTFECRKQMETEAVENLIESLNSVSVK